MIVKLQYSLRFVPRCSGVGIDCNEEGEGWEAWLLAALHPLHLALTADGSPAWAGRRLGGHRDNNGFVHSTSTHPHNTEAYMAGIYSIFVTDI